MTMTIMSPMHYEWVKRKRTNFERTKYSLCIIPMPAYVPFLLESLVGHFWLYNTVAWQEKFRLVVIHELFVAHRTSSRSHVSSITGHTPSFSV